MLGKLIFAVVGVALLVVRGDMLTPLLGKCDVADVAGRVRLLFVLSYGEALYALLYLFAAAGVWGLVGVLVGVLSNSKAATPFEMQNQFQLNRARCVDGNHRETSFAVCEAALTPGLCSVCGTCMEDRTDVWLAWICLGMDRPRLHER